MSSGIPPQGTDTAASTPTVIHCCQRCGACCRWEGDVRVTDEEIRRIAAYLHLEEQEVIDTYCRLRFDRKGLSLIDAPDGACIMLTPQGCRIQEVKPQQCRDFPHRWNFPGWEKLCPGAGKTAPPP